MMLNDRLGCEQESQCYDISKGGRIKKCGRTANLEKGQLKREKGFRKK